MGSCWFMVPRDVFVKRAHHLQERERERFAIRYSVSLGMYISTHYVHIQYMCTCAVCLSACQNYNDPNSRTVLTTAIVTTTGI